MTIKIKRMKTFSPHGATSGAVTFKVAGKQYGYHIQFNSSSTDAQIRKALKEQYNEIRKEIDGVDNRAE